MKNPINDIQRYCDEVTTLRDVLISVQNLVEAPDGAKLTVSDSSLKQCRPTVEELISKLERQFGRKALKWPFSSNNVQTAIKVYTISLALNVEQT